MISFVRLMQKLLFIIILYPLRMLKIKNNRIMFVAPCSGSTYSCNPKYICDYIMKKYPKKFDLVFLVEDVNKYAYLRKCKLNLVKLNTLMQYCYAMTAKIYITNGGMISYIPFRKSQCIIDSWHGVAYKSIGNFTDNIFYNLEVKLNAKKTNLFLSSCTRFSDIVSNTLKMDRKKFLEIGMPRNDIIIRDDKSIKNKIRKLFGIPDDYKIALYAPTYRNAANNNPFLKAVSGDYSLDYDRMLSAFEKRFGGKWCFAYRFHTNIIHDQGYDALSSGLYDFSKYDDMQELLCASDILINDYSSSMWDFSLTGRPCFIFAKDIEVYRNERKFHIPIEEWPFPIAESNEKLESNIIEFDYNVYIKNVRIHQKQMGICETGHASQIVGDKIYKICFGNKSKKKI